MRTATLLTLLAACLLPSAPAHALVNELVIDTPGITNDVQIVGNIAYVSDGNALRIYDVSDPANPSEIGLAPLTTAGLLGRMSVSGDRVYATFTPVPNDPGGFTVFDVSNPNAPIELQTIIGLGSAPIDVFVVGDTVYLASFEIGLFVVDVSDLQSPDVLGLYSASEFLPFAVDVQGSVAYVADAALGEVGVRSLDVANPAMIMELDFLDTDDGSGDGPTDLARVGNTLYVANRTGGLRIVDVTNPSSLSQIAAWPTPQPIWNVTVSGNRAYLGTQVEVGFNPNPGIEIVDVTTPSMPLALGTIGSPDSANGTAVAGSFLYVANDFAGLSVVDATFEDTPADLFAVPQPEARSVAFSQDVAFVAAGTGGLRSIDVSDPLMASEIGSIATVGGANDVEVVGQIAFVADGDGGLRSYDVGNPAMPQFLDSASTGDTTFDVVVAGSLAYVGDGANGLRIYDVSNPAAISFVGGVSTDGRSVRELDLVGSTVYTASSFGGLYVVDVSNPAMPSVVTSFDTAGEARGVTVDGDLAYVADGTNGLLILDISTVPPTPVGGLDLPGQARRVRLQNGLAFVSVQNAGVQVLDVVDPADPFVIGSLVSFNAWQVATHQGTTYVAGDGAGLRVVDFGPEYVPEPAAAIAQMVALLGVLGLRRRRATAA